MPLEISRNDIRSVEADAIVDPTDRYLSGSGGTDRIIHELAGKGLEEKLMSCNELEPGECIITDAYNLDNCRYIIHTCGPVYEDGDSNEENILSSCYRRSLEIARDHGLESIAFPLISSGTFGFPKGKALKIATDTITDFLLENEMNVYLLVYDKEAFDTANRLYKDVRDYINRNLEGPTASISHNSFRKERKSSRYDKVSIKADATSDVYLYDMELASPLFEPDESFSECLIRMIDERNMLDPEVYKRANIDRKHFNHIKNTKDYRPKKETAVALAIGMRLNIKETDTLLERAGFVLSRSSVFDLIIRYCIENKIYDIFKINELLFEQDQKTLGC